MKWKFWEGFRTGGMILPEPTIHKAAGWSCIPTTKFIEVPKLGTTVKEAGISAVMFSKLMRGKELNFIDHLPAVAERHVQRLKEAQKHYGDSWMKRGGVGAFMMMARKWDRIELKLQQRTTYRIEPGVIQDVVPYDIFEHILADDRPEGIADDVRDLIDYLLLVESHMDATGGIAVETGQHRPDEEQPFGHLPDGP